MRAREELEQFGLRILDMSRTELLLSMRFLAAALDALEQRMDLRTASVGTDGYRLLFKKSMTGFYATIAQDANCCVPVVIYRMTAEDEARLDRFEGYPKYYYKREFLLPVWSLKGRRLKKRRECIAYIMHEKRLLGEPTQGYYRLLDEGYEYWGFEKTYLENGLKSSIGNKAAKEWLEAYRRECK